MSNSVPVHLRMLLAALAALMSLVLSASVLTLPAGTSDLADSVFSLMDKSGADHPVTAVLLNFRGYDTMLEIGVLLLALVGVWSFGPAPPDPATLAPAGPVLDSARSVLLPMLLIVAGYLIWVGASAPGGAFQAGAIVAAAGVLAMLTGWRPIPALRPAIEVGLALGLLVFVGVAGGTLSYVGTILLLPEEAAGSMILLIEVAATISIGLALTAVYLGGSPSHWAETR
ncbi:MAG: MnhB domain-containing protein [Pseudomonadales bacterium]